MRLKFELAEPGTDPTKQPNPLPKRSRAEALPWIFLLIAFILGGYLLFGRHGGSGGTGAVRHVTTPHPLPRPAATATPVPTSSPTPTTIVAISPTTPVSTPMLFYGVFEGKAQTVCWCDPATGEAGDAPLCLQYRPEMCR